MTNKWTLLTLLTFMKTSTQSIDGVTYMDDFDFEQRYSNPNDCNPFYWHPLHLPERCAEIFEDAIRTRVSYIAPVHTTMRKRKIKFRKNKQKYNSYEFDSAFYPPETLHEMYDVNEVLMDEEERKPRGPYEQMMHQLRKDISYLPTAPKIANIPGMGPVALYAQPVSKTSKAMIQKIAKIYAKYNRRNQFPYSYPQSEVILKYDEADDDKNTSRENNTAVAKDAT